MASNKKLHSAKKEKNNEFCTGLSNIEKAGKMTADNCQMPCTQCTRTKSGK